VNNDKSVPIITLGEKGDVSVELVPLKPMRDMRHIKGEMKKLLENARDGVDEDFIYVTLTDEDIVSDAMAIFRGYYPNTIKIDYENSHTLSSEQVDISSIAGSKSFEELIKEFYIAMYGCEMNDEEMEIMREAARKAGVTDEAS
jgi:exonuclease SbcD